MCIGYSLILSFNHIFDLFYFDYLIISVGSISYTNTSNAQPNNVGAPIERLKTQSQGQPDQLKNINAKASDNTNNINKILDSEVMIPTSNLQKFIENADKILKNITAAPVANEKCK